MVRFAICSFALASIVWAGHARALTLHLCTNQVPQPPYITPEGDGIADRLIKKAAAEVGITVEYRLAPATRCREELRYGLVDAYPTVPYTPSLAPFVSYPMKGKAPDPARALVTVRNLVFRRVGSKADWDGRRISNVSSAVLVLFAASLPQDRLQAMGVPFDSAGKTARANFEKLLVGRGDLVVSLEAAQGLLALPEFAGRIEVLPIPFTSDANYLGLSNRFVELHPNEAERLWDAIARIRRTAAFEAEARAVVEKYAVRQTD